MVFKIGNKFASIRKGYKHKKSSKDLMSKARIDNKNTLGKHWKMSDIGRKHISDSIKGVNHPFYGKHLSELHKTKIGPAAAYQRILKEVGIFEKQGYRVIPIGKVVPDMIIARWNWKTQKLEIKSVEVEYRVPNYSKYNKDNYKDRFDDVIWLLRKTKKNNTK